MTEPLTLKNIIDIGDGVSFKDDWNQRASLLGADEVAAFGPDSIKLFAEHFGYVVAQRLRELTGATKNDDVLDVGCGPGKMLFWLAPHVRSIVGVDVSDVILKRAAERCRGISNITLHQTDGTNLSMIPSGSVNIAYSFACFIHIPIDVQRAYESEMLRCLKPGGICLLHVRYQQEMKKVKRTYTGASYNEARFEELRQNPAVASITVLELSRADDLVEDLNVRRWIVIRKK